ncbi:MAG: hypothetical protein KDJ75_06750 [Alphaproteobacteria bacterium]|nr:hypothetical protein [Alphaproteobacteria bacterium]
MNAQRQKESGNALIYVLIAIVLFAALSFTLSRQTDTGEAGGLPDEKAELYATQIIAYAAQAKSVVDQMLLSGSKIDQLDFSLPGTIAFNTAPHIHKVYHPEGGGLIPGRLPEQAVTQTTTDPEAGWYMGRFNNVEWTASGNNDVILVAYQIAQAVCAKINEDITGSTSIPVMTDSIKNTMIDESLHTGTNTELTTDAPDICPACDKAASLCVQNQAQTAYGFYTILADQ